MENRSKCKTLRLSKNVIFRQLDKNDGILLNLHTKNYYSLNETACFVVKSIKKGSSRAKLKKEIVNKFDAPVKKINADINRIITFLLKEKILT